MAASSIEEGVYSVLRSCHQVSPKAECFYVTHCKLNDTQLAVSLCLLVLGYLESFEESRAQEQDKMTQSQENIVSLLEHCSRVRRKGGAGERKEGRGE